MISLPEQVLHDFRAVARRAGRNARLPQSALFHLLSGKDGIRVQTLDDCTRIEYHHPTPATSTSFVLPMSIMADREQSAPWKARTSRRRIPRRRGRVVAGNNQDRD